MNPSSNFSLHLQPVGEDALIMELLELLSSLCSAWQTPDYPLKHRVSPLGRLRRVGYPSVAFWSFQTVSSFPCLQQGMKRGLWTPYGQRLRHSFLHSLYSATWSVFNEFNLGFLKMPKPVRAAVRGLVWASSNQTSQARCPFGQFNHLGFTLGSNL